MATRSEQIEFIKRLYPSAYRLYAERDGIHPVFVTAQAALETGWKIRGISGGNNIFGITKGSWKGKTDLVLTKEIFKTPNVTFREPERIDAIEPLPDGTFRYHVYREFRSYETLDDCLDDHLSVLRGKGYSDAFPYRKDAKEFARRIVDEIGAKYATAPNYYSVMSGVIDVINMRINEIKALPSGVDPSFYSPL